jgi:tetratricopeptide (TPR) repeat protein
MTTELLANRYRPVRPLGEGAMGAVLLVEDTTNGAQVALKAISRKIGATEKSVLQFKQEFHLMTQLRHPNCCEVYDYGVLDSGEPYFTMEVVPGKGLDELVPLKAQEFEQIMGQLALALGYVHQLGFVHRDLKSANVRVKPDGTVKLMDYGLMEHAGRGGEGIAGTIGYMAPELIKRAPVDQRADLYALGCLGYEMLTGRLPFLAERPMDVLRAHVQEKPAPPSSLRAGLAPAQERLVLALLGKEPIDRPRSAAAVLDALGIEAPAGIGGNLLAAPLLGREREAAVLLEGLARTAKGGPAAFYVLSGAAGIGKSRLVDELVCRAQLENVPVGMGNMDQQDVVPYAAFIDALRELLPALRQEVPAELAAAAPVLVALLPELGSAAAPSLDAPAKEKQRTMAAMADVLFALARKRPTLLVLENWQWVDPLGQEMLAFLRRTAGAVPLMVLLTSRQREGGARDLVEVPLLPLDGEGVGRMLAAMLGQPTLPPGFVQEVATISEGNPFFVEKLLDHLVKAGLLKREAGSWAPPAHIPRELVPQNLEGLLRDKLAELTEGALTMARIGALLGRQFELDLLVQVAAYPEDELIEALGQLQAQQIFQPAGERRYRFTYDQFQALLYDDLPMDERVFMHGLVAQVLAERLGDRAPAEVGLELLTALATHAIGAGDAVGTIAYGLPAAKRLLGMLSLEEAERFLEAGLAVTQGQPRWDRERVKLLHYLGDIHRIHGQLEKAQATYEQAQALADACGADDEQVRLLTSQGRVATMLNDLPRTVELCKRAIAAATVEDAELARAHLTCARALLFIGEAKEARELAQRGLEIAKRVDAQVYVGEAMSICGTIAVQMGGAHLAEGVADLHVAVEIMRGVGDRVGQAASLIMLGDGQMGRGDFLAARTSFEQAAVLNRATNNPPEEVFALLNLAIVSYELGELREAVRYGRETIAMANGMEMRLPGGMAVAVEAAGRLHSGELEEVDRVVPEVVATAQAIKSKYLECLAMPFGLEILLALGRFDEAERMAADLEALIEATGNRYPEALLAVRRAQLLGRRGDLAGAGQAANRALELAHQKSSQALVAHAQAVRAWLALRDGRTHDAVTLGKEALELATARGMGMLAAELEGLLGEAALALQEGGAGARFRAMLAWAEAQGAPVHAALAELGLAACEPATGAARAAEAKARLQRVLATLDADGRAAIARRVELKRVLDGDYQALGRQAAPATPHRPLGLDQGLRKLF